MKANEFIKKFGLRLAKLALKEIHLSDDDGLLRVYKCPECSALIVDENTNGYYGCKFCDGVDADLVSFKIDCVDDLKRLIEAHDFVEEMGGYEHVKNAIAVLNLIIWEEPSDRALKAIADVESCQ